MGERQCLHLESFHQLGQGVTTSLPIVPISQVRFELSSPLIEIGGCEACGGGEGCNHFCFLKVKNAVWDIIVKANPPLQILSGKTSG